MAKAMRQLKSLDEILSEWKVDENNTEYKSLTGFQDSWDKYAKDVGKTLIQDNKPQWDSFVMRKESASIAPGPHPEMVRAHNIRRGGGS
ncbi:MAG: hypothetical protein FWH01_12920 [Oscillospiraceae bacterium]|nr:hypothetical protein [Oscillospiraceae bacterium]